MSIYQYFRNIVWQPRAFFLENIGVKQTVFKNIFWLALAESITRFLKLILIIYIARILGATEYGKFTFALAFVSLFVVFSDLGVSQITTRDFARAHEKEQDFSSVLSLKILLSSGALIFMLVGSFLITFDPAIRRVIGVLAVYILTNSFADIIYAFLRARQHMEYEAYAKMLQAIAVTGVGFFVIAHYPSITNLAYSYLLANAIGLIFVSALFHFKIARLRISFRKSIWKNLLRMSWPLALGGICAAIYTNIDSAMMGYWGQITQTGWYNAAYKIVGVTLIPVGLVGIGFYPALSKSSAESKEKLQKIWDSYLEAMIFLAIPLVVGGIVLGQKLINFVYQPGYDPSILTFQILTIMAGISFLSVPFSQILIVSNQQKKTFWVALSGAIINVILNMIFIPRYSLYGAAVTTVITAAAVFLLLYTFASKLIPIKPLSPKLFLHLGGAGCSSIPMCLVVSQSHVHNLHVLLSIVIGACTYLICLTGYKRLVSQFLDS